MVMSSAFHFKAAIELILLAISPLLLTFLQIFSLTLNFFLLIFITVRQENERLLQDSLNRAKMAVNFTEPPLLSTTTTSSPLASHAPNYIP